MDTTQLRIAHPDSQLSEDHGPGSLPLVGKSLSVGDRAPDARLVAANGADTRLFDWIYNPGSASWGWRLLMFDGREATARSDFARVAKAVAPWSWVKPLSVLATPPEDDQAPADGPRLYDLDGNAHRAYGLENKAALVLVRPDGHIAFRAKPGESERLATYCRRVGAC